MKPPDFREKGGPSARRQVTVMESVEEIRALVRRSNTVGASELPSTLAISSASDATEPFRPMDRPSMAILTVIDDGDDTGEQVRIRAGTFVIGRVDGDLVIPHDVGISGRHVEIVRRSEGGQHRWLLRDLQSTNGTFVRASNVTLQADQEVSIGRGRFRFEPAGSVLSASTAPGRAEATRKWQTVSPEDIAAASNASLVELTPQGEGRRFSLTEPEIWIGRDQTQCAIVLNDPTVDPRHARAYQDARDRWVLENARSMNGLWVRVQEIALDRGGQFQCGEQRFSIRVL